MDGPLCVGRRLITRTFEQDRHSRAVLAEAFEWLTDASPQWEPVRDSVQTVAQAEPPLQEASR